MTTAAQALAAVRAVISGGSLSFPVYYHGDDPPLLPDVPAAFAYVVFINYGSGGGPASFGGGRGANRYRNRAALEVWVFDPPNGADGMGSVMVKAEAVAALLRSYRDEDISVFAADVQPAGPGSVLAPPGIESDVTNYVCAIADVALTFDQIG